MKTIMISQDAWKDCWNLFRANPSFVATAKNLTESIDSIKTVNSGQKTLAALRNIGLIDDKTGKLTSLGVLWADPTHYAETCQRIIDGFFPFDLVQKIRLESLTRKDIARWLEANEGMGEAGSEKNATLLCSLLEWAASEPPISGERFGKDDLSASPDAIVKAHSADQPSPATRVVVDTSLDAETMAKVLSVIPFSEEKFEIVFK